MIKYKYKIQKPELLLSLPLRASICDPNNGHLVTVNIRLLEFYLSDIQMVKSVQIPNF